jgi:hypothetical protein
MPFKRHRSSASFATLGNSSEIIKPLLPAGENFHGDCISLRLPLPLASVGAFPSSRARAGL